LYLKKKRILKKNNHGYHKTLLSGTTVFHIDNDKKCFLISKSAY